MCGSLWCADCADDTRAACYCHLHGKMPHRTSRTVDENGLARHRAVREHRRRTGVGVLGVAQAVYQPHGLMRGNGDEFGCSAEGAARLAIVALGVPYPYTLAHARRIKAFAKCNDLASAIGVGNDQRVAHAAALPNGPALRISWIGAGGVDLHQNFAGDGDTL